LKRIENGAIKQLFYITTESSVIVDVVSGLFNYVFSSSGYIAFSGRTINEFERMWKKMVVAHFNKLT
jgi:hypothetical protein